MMREDQQTRPAILAVRHLTRLLQPFKDYAGTVGTPLAARPIEALRVPTLAQSHLLRPPSTCLRLEGRNGPPRAAKQLTLYT